MIDAKALRPQVAALEKDLRPTGETDPAQRAEWQEAHDGGRIAAGYEEWLSERVTQVAVAWVLATVFIRFCEDNGLIEYPFITGPDAERAAQARELQAKFFEDHPEKDDYGWLEVAIDALSVSPVAAGLFDREHNPMWMIKPSPFAIKELLAFWRTTDADGKTIYTLKDDDWNTRFLGDLYQNLSESARKTYALLQTPEFVEEFILKYTLGPAIEEFGLEPDPPYGHDDLPKRLRFIDPACGSGHFLLGAFRRLLKAWEDEHPGADRHELVANALESVHGVDKNPFAAAIARFRLLLAAMRAAGVGRLNEQVDFPLFIAVGDSLLYGKGAPGVGTFDYMFRTEDVDEYLKPPIRMLSSGSYHVVVGNPPYITVKDPQENKNYRAYKSCSGIYHLSVPFTERMFQLSIRGAYDGGGAGYVGLISDNAFMDREFGKKLIEEYFPNIDLTHIIDTSGAFIPGHGTPTVMLFGRRRFSRSDSTVRAVLGNRGEPSEPPVPAEGSVWRAIETQVDEPGSESEWVTAADVQRDRFAKYPWSLSGGGASELTATIEQWARTLKDRLDVIGRTTHTGSDDCFYMPESSAKTRGLESSCVPVVLGEDVRDFVLTASIWTLFPYSSNGSPRVLSDIEERFFWPNRTVLRLRVDYGQHPEERGLRWFDHSMFFPGRFIAPLCIPFAFVATHNHFVLDRGGKVFNRSAPVIKLPEGATQDEHLALLGVLNSSTACFWLKQVSHDKGSQGINEGFKSQEWERFYEFTGTKLEKFPLPPDLPLHFGRELDSLAQQVVAVEPSAVCDNGVPTRGRLNAARAEHERIRGRMIVQQEELDWDVYHRYGLLTDSDAAEVVESGGNVPDLRLGERAFEIVLARRMRDEGLQTQWFARHRSTPITEIPTHWPSDYKAVVEKRIQFIEQNRNIGLIERPECKRRWLSETWEEKESKALRNWLLDRSEERSLWFGPDGQPRAITVNRLADILRADADLVAVARLYAGDEDADLAEVLKEIIDDEHVPYLTRLRYKGEGLVKRAIWERTWELQRDEDKTGKTLKIDVPPKYKNTDFHKPSYWRNRGKLDVPKERFVSYPKASPDSDGSLLLGWAGWDYREQAHALVSLIEERETTDGWHSDRIRPLVVGLAEVMPWVRQWYNEVDPNFGQSPADVYDSYLNDKRGKHGLGD